MNVERFLRVMCNTDIPELPEPPKPVIIDLSMDVVEASYIAEILIDQLSGGDWYVQ